MAAQFKHPHIMPSFRQIHGKRRMAFAEVIGMSIGEGAMAEYYRSGCGLFSLAHHRTRGTVATKRKTPAVFGCEEMNLILSRVDHIKDWREK
jgi:hypothetical protein